MKTEKLLNAIGKIDDNLIYGAVNDAKTKKKKYLDQVERCGCFPCFRHIFCYTVHSKKQFYGRTAQTSYAFHFRNLK